MLLVVKPTKPENILWMPRESKVVLCSYGSEVWNGGTGDRFVGLWWRSNIFRCVMVDNVRVELVTLIGSALALVVGMGVDSGAATS